jgi:hypothetical protein
MKWIGQHIYDLVARFRNDVYLEDLSTTTETNVLVVDSDGKVSKTTVITGDVTGVTAGSNITVTDPSGPTPTVALNTSLTDLTSVTSTSFVGALTGNADTATKIASITNSDIVQLGATQTLTFKTLFRPTIEGYATFEGSTSGTTKLEATAVAGTTFLTLPAATDTLVGKATADILTNKTLTAPTITGAGAIAGVFTGNITGNVTGNADTVTTNANLTGPVTSSGNITAIASGAITTAMQKHLQTFEFSGYSSGPASTALYQNTTGNYNMAVGHNAGEKNTTGAGNVALGYAALYQNTTGSYNIAVGHNAGRYISGGVTNNTVTDNSVFLGQNTKALADSQTNQIVIGYDTTGLGSNTAILGNSSITKTQLQGDVGIGTAAPLNKLDIVGSLGRGAPVIKTTNFTVAATENWLIMNGTATITITLPTASDWTGRELMIKNIAAYTVISASSNVKPIDTNTAATAILPATAGSWCTLVSDGTNWVTMMSS